MNVRVCLDTLNIGVFPVVVAKLPPLFVIAGIAGLHQQLVLGVAQGQTLLSVRLANCLGLSRETKILTCT